MGNCRRKSVSLISKIRKFLVLYIAKQIGQEKSGAWKEQKISDLSWYIWKILIPIGKNMNPKANDID